MKNLLTYLFIFTLAINGVKAQVIVSGNATGKHEKVINTAKGTRDRASERKAQAKKIKDQNKERVRQIKDYKKAKREYSEEYEKRKSERLRSFERDSVDAPKWSKEDSIAISDQILYGMDFPEKYRDVMINPPTKLDLPELDSAGFNIDNAVENQAKEYIPGELGQPGEDPIASLPGNPMEGGMKNPGLENLKKPSRRNPNLVKPDAAKKLFNKIDPKQFKNAQANIKKLKKKYASIPDTRFPEEAKKRNSLEDVSFKKRLYFGGTINVGSTDPLILDSGLKLGYWINKKWLAGAGFLIREQFNDKPTQLTGDSHGHSFFSQYDIPKGFFIWVEMERQIEKSLFKDEIKPGKSWQSAHLLGLGREYKIGPVAMMTMVSYDFNFKNNDMYGRPLVFKFGFRFNKKPKSE